MLRCPLKREFQQHFTFCIQLAIPMDRSPKTFATSTVAEFSIGRRGLDKMEHSFMFAVYMDRIIMIYNDESVNGRLNETVTV